MELEFEKILEKTRDFTYDKGIKRMSMDEIANSLKVPKKILLKYVKNKQELVTKVLDFERDSFGTIFEEYNFEGVNAIDILMIVGKEISKRFKKVNPMVTYEIQKYYPALYQKHIEKRIDFIYEKMKINIEKGICQGMYRDDLSVELVARLYISRLIDMHNPELFPPDKFSFPVLFDVMFDNFVRGIANPTGIAYYEQKKQALNLK
jgi:AcrR family transcriptional regulator